MIYQALYIIELIFLCYLGFNVLYVSVFSIAGSFFTRTDFRAIKVEKYNRFVILIPAFKSDEVILNTVGHALNQNYPTEKFDVIVIADSLKQLTIGELLVMPIKLIPVQFEFSTKAKSLNTALGLLPDNAYDYCVVLDVDNIMEQDFLRKINARLQNDELVVQGHRTAKNLDSAFAILDGISEEINNHIFRRGHIAFGLSSALSGSGQSINYKFFKEAMFNIHSPVEDKELEFYLVKNNIKVLFEEDALIYDEKVQNSAVFMKQRKRWVASQFFDFNSVLLEGIANLVLHGNFDFFDKALQRILMPRVLLLGISFFMALTVITPIFHFGPLFFAMFILVAFSYLIAIPSHFFNSNTFFAALRVPQAFLLMLLAMFRSKGAAKVFNHTKHTTVVGAKIVGSAQDYQENQKQINLNKQQDEVLTFNGNSNENRN
jgi:cellulose synthase/poly-beta-1,6-N-acetylglucosamine synthase-like glycosyltransferase